MKLGVVTATTDRARAEACIGSWYDHAATEFAIEIVFNGHAHGDYLGCVPAFRLGVDSMLAHQPDVEVIACLHDDFRIDETGWDTKVLRHFAREPRCGLAGFGGAVGLGSHDLYHTPYQPIQLARQGFRSNLVDAEVHGIRSLLPERVACLDGFSQIGSRAFFDGLVSSEEYQRPGVGTMREHDRPWTYLERLGIVHHFYDGCLGCLARRYGWETWYLPVAGQHYGGQTAVGDAGYQAWAKAKTPEGDMGFWAKAHEIGYEEFRDVLPLRV